MNKSYCDEVSQNLTTSVTECIFVSYTRERRDKQTITFLVVTWLLFVKGHKIESQRNIKNKFDFGVVLWVTPIIFTKSALEITEGIGQTRDTVDTVDWDTVQDTVDWGKK